MTSFNWNLILHAKFLTPPIEDIDAFYFSFHGEYEELHYYPKSDVSHPKYKHIHTHTCIATINVFNLVFLGYRCMMLCLVSSV